MAGLVNKNMPNSRLIDPQNNVGAHTLAALSWRLAIKNSRSNHFNFWAGRHVSDSIETQEIEFIMHHYFFVAFALIENTARQKDNNAIRALLLVLVL